MNPLKLLRLQPALLGSIEKWEAIFAGTGQDLGVSNCPLCRTYRWEDHVNYCTGCPVQTKTGKSSCQSTPYAAWDEYFTQYKLEEDLPIVEQPVEHQFALYALAWQELQFLRSLSSQLIFNCMESIVEVEGGEGEEPS